MDRCLALNGGCAQDQAILVAEYFAVSSTIAGRELRGTRNSTSGAYTCCADSPAGLVYATESHVICRTHLIPTADGIVQPSTAIQLKKTAQVCPEENFCRLVSYHLLPGMKGPVVGAKNENGLRETLDRERSTYYDRGYTKGADKGPLVRPRGDRQLLTKAMLLVLLPFIRFSQS
jgi:hypothetical protein